jgi:hypothetical protein
MSRSLSDHDNIGEEERPRQLTPNSNLLQQYKRKTPSSQNSSGEEQCHMNRQGVESSGDASSVVVVEQLQRVHGDDAKGKGPSGSCDDLVQKTRRPPDRSNSILLLSFYYSQPLPPASLQQEHEFSSNETINNHNMTHATLLAEAQAQVEA